MMRSANTFTETNMHSVNEASVGDLALNAVIVDTRVYRTRRTPASKQAHNESDHTS
jgi:hypothetical protein